jgi:hypothetical protein
MKLKISNDTDRLITHIFNFHLNMRQICCSPTAFVSTVMSHDPLDRKTFGSHGIKNVSLIATWVFTRYTNMYRVFI